VKIRHQPMMEEARKVIAGQTRRKVGESGGIFMPRKGTVGMGPKSYEKPRKALPAVQPRRKAVLGTGVYK